MCYTKLNNIKQVNGNFLAKQVNFSLPFFFLGGGGVVVG